MQIGWPPGMPLVRETAANLYDRRIALSGRIARVPSTIVDEQVVLLHGVDKKSRATPRIDLDTAKARTRQGARGEGIETAGLNAMNAAPRQKSTEGVTHGEPPHRR
ncbi:type II toxin-antitoxin system RelE/ParE family toxin [Burkholderia plantarii]|uniref:type II toxin-antitoxin system RelE/ParE family toxin n=1 Tax=Burkholderia plantarii TaxID=41899 RepID=UPI000870957C